jgi:hypothetical protein
MKRTGIEREEPAPKGIPITLTNTAVLAIFTACIGFATPRVYDFFVGQTADSASRLASAHETERTQGLLIAARDKQMAALEHDIERLDLRLQSLESWAREKRLH